MERLVNSRITVESLMQWRAYAQHRLVHRPRMIAHRLARTITLGPHMQLQFEDEATIRYQIQEVLHIEKIIAPDAIAHEIANYVHLLPDGFSWHATLMIQIPCRVQRERLLPSLSRAAHHIYVEPFAAERIVAITNDDLTDRHLSRPSAVHFLRFPLFPAAHAINHEQQWHIGCADSTYLWRRAISPITLKHLQGELAIVNSAQTSRALVALFA